MPKPTVADRARAVQSSYLTAAEAQDQFFAAETEYRIARRKAELRAKEANPKAPAAAVELVVESDPEYRTAQQNWHRAHGHKTRAFGEYEVAKLMAWAEVRSING